MKLACDVDATVWDIGAWMRRACSRITGGELRPEQIDHWWAYHSLVGTEAAERAFAEVLDPSRVPDRAPYPGLAPALRRIRSSGMSLHFITHNPEPDAIREPLSRWLAEHAASAFELTVLVDEHSKVEFMLAEECSRGGADYLGIVDDKPDTLRQAASAGYLAATIAQPHNNSLRGDRRIRFFEDWHHAPAALGL